MYAQQTQVSTDISRAEIERTLQRYGADQFMYGWDACTALVGFRMLNRQVRFVLPLPDRNDAAFKAWEQAFRQSWRALALVIKAKLEAVESGIAIFDKEFLANIVLPDNSTVGQFMLPQVNNAYETGDMPPLLPDLRNQE